VDTSRLANDLYKVNKVYYFAYLGPQFCNGVIMDNEIKNFAAILLLKLIMGKAILINLSENSSLALFGGDVLVSIIAYTQSILLRNKNLQVQELPPSFFAVRSFDFAE
jgi:hypothetical protein